MMEAEHTEAGDHDHWMPDMLEKAVFKGIFTLVLYVVKEVCSEINVKLLGKYYYIQLIITPIYTYTYIHTYMHTQIHIHAHIIILMYIQTNKLLNTPPLSSPLLLSSPLTKLYTPVYTCI